tara:strand:+ start:2059 stop:2817 length:759 start_codon:yes stop_codon:yes gene_type:complete
MKIAVLIKQVPGSESPLSITNSNTWLDEEKVAYIMNESDNYALEEALLLKEDTQDSEVVVVSLGPERVKKIIREGLAKGADRGIHLNMNSNDLTDPLSIAKIFADALKSENFDLILSGLQSDDLGHGQTGIIIGELLNMSTGSLAVSTKLDGNQIAIKQELEAGFFQNVRMTLPASITIQSGLNTPRYPSLKGIMGAKKKEIKTLDIDSLDQSLKISKLYLPSSSNEITMIDGSSDQIVESLIKVFKSEIKI